MCAKLQHSLGANELFIAVCGHTHRSVAYITIFQRCLETKTADFRVSAFFGVILHYNRDARL